jgi:hypothetical protein
MSSEEKGKGPKYFINIEGKEIPWEKDTITTEEIISLGGWEPNMGAIEINLKDNTERTLQSGEVVTIKPGHGYSKKVRYKRGLNFG